ncbi:hypothetical protein HCY99_05885 [Limosilactobacillus fermentum]
MALSQATKVTRPASIVQGAGLKNGKSGVTRLRDASLFCAIWSKNPKIFSATFSKDNSRITDHDSVNAIRPVFVTDNQFNVLGWWPKSRNFPF